VRALAEQPGQADWFGAEINYGADDVDGDADGADYAYEADGCWGEGFGGQGFECGASEQRMRWGGWGSGRWVGDGRHDC